MTVSTSTNSVVYRGNGAATQFAVPFKVMDEDHLVVTRRDYDTGDLDYTYIGTDYSYTGVGDDSGTLTLAGTALDDDFELVIERIVPYTQDLDIVNAGGFYPETVENQLDTIVMGIQQLADLAGRGISVPVGEDGLTLPAAATRANRYPVFLPDGSMSTSEGTGSDAALRGDLGDEGGGALIILKQPSSAARIRSAQEIYEEGLSALDFATGLGVVDDAPKMQDFFNEIGSLGVRGKVPYGIYRLGEPIRYGLEVFDDDWSTVVDRTNPRAYDDVDDFIAVNYNANKDDMVPVDIDCQNAIFAADFVVADPTPIIEFNVPHWRGQGRWGGRCLIVPIDEVPGGLYTGAGSWGPPPANNLIGLACPVPGFQSVSGITFGFLNYGLATNGPFSCSFENLRADNCVDAFHFSVANGARAHNLTSWYSERGIIFDGDCAEIATVVTQHVGEDLTVMAAQGCEFRHFYMEDTDNGVLDGAGKYALKLGGGAGVARVAATQFKGLRFNSDRTNKKPLRFHGCADGVLFEGIVDLMAAGALGAGTIDATSTAELKLCNAAFRARFPVPRTPTRNGVFASPVEQWPNSQYAIVEATAQVPPALTDYGTIPAHGFVDRTITWATALTSGATRGVGLAQRTAGGDDAIIERVIAVANANFTIRAHNPTAGDLVHDDVAYFVSAWRFGDAF